MTPAEADWVAGHVLGAAMLQSYGPQRSCPCRGGVCGHCQGGHHRSCMVVAWGGAPRVQCEGWITDRKARVKSPDVWRAGRPCRWICACGCDPYAPPLPPAGDLPPMQLDLLSALAGA